MLVLDCASYDPAIYFISSSSNEQRKCSGPRPPPPSTSAASAPASSSNRTAVPTPRGWVAVGCCEAEHAECLGDTGVVAVAGVLGLGDDEREGGDGVINTQRLRGGAGRGVSQCWSRRRGAGM